MQHLGRRLSQSYTSFRRCASTWSMTIRPEDKFSYACSRSLDRNIIQYHHIFYRGTHDPIWLFMKRLKYPGNESKLRMMLEAHQVSWQEYVQTWKPVVYSSNIDYALSTLEEMGTWSRKLDIPAQYSPTYDDVQPFEKPRLPFWLVMHIASHKVRTRSQAHGILQEFVFSQLPYMPPTLQPALLIVLALSLARFSLLAPMRRLVQSFLAIPQHRNYEQLYFNILLQTIARFDPSLESADLAVTLLQAMDSRQLRLHSMSYLRLLSDRFVTVQLTKMLWNRMKHEGFVPTKEHLESFLRIFAKEGSIHDSMAYLEEIRTWLPKNISKAVPSNAQNQDTFLASPDHAHTLYMNAFRQDRVSAFRYLDHLLQCEKQRKSVPALPDPILPSEPQLKHRFQNQTRLGTPKREFINVHDWTTALAVAARDLSGTTAEMLIRLFERVSKTATFRPTVATYTVVVRGLLHRKKFPEAEGFWRALESSGLPIDRMALTAGLEVMTRAGKPHNAFALLEKYAEHRNPRLGTPRPPSRTSQAPILMNVIAMNQFLISLVRVRRPDVVFRLWDYMELLYGVRPDARSLSILLNATRVATKNDDSFRGTLAQLSQYFSKPRARLVNREDAVSSIKSILGDPSRGLVPYRSGIWNGVPAWQTARQIFRQVILGNCPAIKSVQSPAIAVRASEDDSSFRPMLQLARSAAKPLNQSVFPPLPVKLHRAHDGLYPEIVPTDETFLRYIQVLAEHSFASEIPLALAWMRALDITPRRMTLTMALVFWGEVSLHPLVERFSPETSEYAKLFAWMRDWVPPALVPRDNHIASCLRMVARMRQSRNVTLGMHQEKLSDLRR